MAKKYIPNNAWLSCDKGEIPTQIAVTHDNNSSIYGEKLVSEADTIPNENIKPFGKCSLTGGPCTYKPIYWDKCNEGVKVNGFKLVFEDAHLLCQQTGKIKVDFNVPVGGSGLIGGGYGLYSGSSMLGSTFGFSAADLRANPTSGLANSTQLGNWGEIAVAQDLKRLGYQVPPGPQAPTVLGGGHQGLDLPAYDPKGNVDILGEVKTSMAANAGSTPPRMNPANPASGLPTQMSDPWLTNGQFTGSSRIDQAMPADDATRVLGKMNNGGDGVIKVATKVDGNTGSITHYEVDANGTVGNRIELPPANVVSGNSKAANLINSVSESIQSQKNVAAANRFLVNNADVVAKVGKVVGRGAVVVGIVMDAYSIGSAYAEEGEFGDKTQQATGSAIGGAAGAWAGAELGAAIGVVGGPVGVIVGGVVGGIIGGVIGSGVGSKVMDWLF